MSFTVVFHEGVSDQNKALSLMYWECNLNQFGYFKYRVAEVGARFGMSRNHIPDAILASSYAFFPDSTCTDCHISLRIALRTHGSKELCNPVYFTCSKCIKVNNSEFVKTYSSIKKQLIARRSEELPELVQLLDSNRDRQLANASPITSLSILDKFLLVACFKEHGMFVINNPVTKDSRRHLKTEYEKPFTPTVEINTKLIKRLYEANLLLPSHEGSYRPFSIDAKGALVINFEVANFGYAKGYSFDVLNDLKQQLTSLEARKALVQHPEYSEWLQIIHYAEVMQHLIERAAEARLKIDVDTINPLTINAYINKFPLFVCFFIITRVVQQTYLFMRNRKNTDGLKLTRVARIEKNIRDTNTIIQNVLDSTLASTNLDTHSSYDARKEFGLQFTPRYGVFNQSHLSEALINNVFNIYQTSRRYSLSDILRATKPCLNTELLVSAFDSLELRSNSPSWEKTISITGLPTKRI